MRFNKRFVPILLTAMVASASVSPAFSQATTLAGSVQQHAAAVQNIPTLKQQNAQMDYRKPVVINRTVYETGASHPVYYQDRRPYFQRHPKVKAAVVGAGVGAATGGVVGLVSGRGIMRGALIGGGTGAGVGLIRSSSTMKRHPLVKDLATGAAVGFGLGAASSRHGSTMLKSAAVGGAVGGGIHFLKKLF